MTDDNKIKVIYPIYSDNLLKLSIIPFLKKEKAMLNIGTQIDCKIKKVTPNHKNYRTPYVMLDERSIGGIKTNSILVHKKENSKHKKRKKCQVYKYNAHNLGYVIERSKVINKTKEQCIKHFRTPEFIIMQGAETKPVEILKERSETFTNHHTSDDLAVDVTKNPLFQTKWKIYRCQLNTQEETCCCSCNSDAMFEVMKSLYDCYKKKNCDNCNCILCGHLPKEERQLGELRKSGIGIGPTIIESSSMRERREKKMKKAKELGLLTPLEGKSTEEKEKIMRGLAKEGLPIPEAKTKSEKEISKRIRQELGLPPEPRTASEREKYKKAEATGLLTPLEGKSADQKETILRKQLEAGIPLPEARTSSEKAIIEKIKATTVVADKKTQSERLRKAKDAGFITPLEGKTPAEKEKILKGMAMHGVPLPEGKTASEKKLVEKVRNEVGLPPEPKTSAAREKYKKAMQAGIVTPLAGKSTAQKEKILKAQYDMGLPLPEGRTSSEKAIIAKIKTMPKAPSGGPSAIKVPSEKLRKAKAAGLLTPLEGKSPAQKEKILKGMAMHGIPLPEGKTASEKMLVEKVRNEVGLPPEPKTSAAREKYKKAMQAGIVTPLAGKSTAQKEKILKAQYDMGLPLPEGRTSSEKAIIAKIKTMPKAPSGGPSAIKVPSEKLRKAKAAGVLTPLEGKSPAQKEKILKGMAMHGIPLPEGKTASEKMLVEKVRNEVGLPPEPKTSAAREKYKKAMQAGVVTPLAGKSTAQKEKILKAQYDMGLPLPEGRTSSEKAIIAKIKTMPKAPSEGPSAIKVPSEKLRKAKAAGVLTPLEGKTPAQKEKILKGMAMHGIPLPEGKTASEKKLVEKVRNEVGLPPEPKTSAAREKYKKAMQAGIVTPLAGKSTAQKEKILKAQYDMGLPLPEGRTSSEKAIIAKIKTMPKAPSGGPSAIKVPSEKLRKAKAAGVLTPLEGKSPAQKEKILKGMAMHGIPLPEGKTASEKMLVEKVLNEVGLPPEPKTSAAREKYKKAMQAGVVTPLAGKSTAQKEKILKAQYDMGLPLPEGRTSSEKAMIAKIKTMPRAPSEGPSAIKVPSEKLRKAKAAGVLTPLEGKTPAQKEKILKGMAMHGIPLPEGKTASEKKLVEKVRNEVGLPPEPKTSAAREKYKKAMQAGVVTPLAGKSTAQKEKILKAQYDMGLPLPEGRTSSEKAIIAKIKTMPKAPSGGPSAIKVPSEKLRKAKAAGVLTPLEGKSPAQKEKIVKGMAMHGIPLPEGKTASEKMLVEKVRNEVGLPPEPKTSAAKEKYKKAMQAGVVTPLAGKSTAQKEKILKAQYDMGLPLPEGRTSSEKAMIAKIKTMPRAPSGGPTAIKVSSEATPAKPGRPALPPDKRKNLEETTAKVIKEAKGPSDECICDLLTPESERITKISKAAAGLTPSAAPSAVKIPSEKLRKAKAAGLLTPLEGKSPEQKEKILRGLAKAGIPLPDGKTKSEKELVKKVQNDMGLPQPKTSSEKQKVAKAQAAGIITPLEGKTPQQKEKVLRAMAEAGVPLPEGRSPSEKDLIRKVKASVAIPSKIPSEKLRQAKAAGLLTPLDGKTPEQKENIVRSRLAAGLPSPEAKTPSEKALIEKVRTEMKVPEKKTPSEKLRQAKAAGLLTPLEGKSTQEKEKIIKGLAKAGLPLPEAKTSSEKDLIRKVRNEIGLPPEPKTPSMKEKYQKALAAGVITPLEGKTLAQKEKILKNMQDSGIPLPEGRTPSEKEMIRKVKAGIVAPSSMTGPPAPALPLEEARRLDEKTAKVIKEGKGPSDECICGLLAPVFELKVVSKGKVPSEKLRKAKAAGFLTPLEGKTPEEKEKVLKGLATHGIPLPEGKTASEKKLIEKVRKDLGLPPEPKTSAAKQKYNKAVTDGIITPLEGKSPEKKEKILKGLATHGIPLPEGKTASEKKLIEKVRKQVGLPPEPKTSASKHKYNKAVADGLVTPLEGKTAAQKEKIVRGLAEAGLPLPEGRTASEKALIAKVKGTTAPSETTPSVKEKVKKAKEAGLLTPLEGKSLAQKEKIIKGLIASGMPIPEGKTESEKGLIKKLRTEAGLSPEPTPSERKRAIKMKSKGVGVVSKKSAKGMVARSTAGIVEEFQDVTKTTKCDRACGCDKKKIRFKHSYVKIRVTSPDISTLCPCPEECLPGVKNGVFTDNEGIKVTVGSAIGVPSFNENNNKLHAENSYDDQWYHSRCLRFTNDNKRNNELRIHNSFDSNDNEVQHFKNNSEEFRTIFEKHDVYENQLKSCIWNNVNIREKNDDDCVQITIQTSGSSYSCEELYLVTSSDCSLNSYVPIISSETSFESIIINKTDSSVSLVTDSDTSVDMDTVSVIGSSNSSGFCSTYTSQQYSNNYYVDVTDNTEDSDTLILRTNHMNAIRCPFNRNCYAVYTDGKENNIFIFRANDIKNKTMKKSYDFKNKILEISNDNKSVIVMSDLDHNNEIAPIVNQIISKQLFCDTSSIFVIVPPSDNTDIDNSDDFDSTAYVPITDVSSDSLSLKNASKTHYSIQQKRTSSTFHGVTLSTKGGRFFMDGIPVNNFIRNTDKDIKAKSFSMEDLLKQKIFHLPKFLLNRKAKHSVCIDTSEDRPCYCEVETNKDIFTQISPTQLFTTQSANVISEVITPILMKRGVEQGLNEKAYIPDQRLRTFQTDSYVHQNASITLSKMPACVPTANGAHTQFSNKPTHRVPYQYSNSNLTGGTHNKQCPLKNMKQEAAKQDHTNKSCESCFQNDGMQAHGSLIKDRRVAFNDDCPCLSTTQMIGTQIMPYNLREECIQPPQKKTVEKSKIKSPEKKISIQQSGTQANIKKSAKSGPLMISEFCQCYEDAETETEQKPPCECKSKKTSTKRKEKKKKYIICECPPAEIDFEDFDENELRKMVSELTQRTSGFRVSKKKRQLEEMMSFEDAIKFYEEHPELAPAIDEYCKCPDDKIKIKKYKNVDCSCPFEPPAVKPEETPPGGLKLFLEGKGSGSKGLNGICCFKLLTDEKSELNKDITDSDSIVLLYGDSFASINNAN